MAGKIALLYSKVTSKAKVENKQLTLQFAKVVVAYSKGLKVNWATYAIYLHKHRVQVRIVKENKKATVALSSLTSDMASGS